MGKQERTNRIYIALITVVVMIVVNHLSTILGFTVPIIEIFLVVLVGFSVGPLIGERMGAHAGIFYSGTTQKIKIPYLSEAESAMKRQDLARAKELYLRAQHDYPTYLPLYHPLFELLIRKLHDTETARIVYRSGWAVSDSINRKKLEHLFEEYPH